MLYCIGILCTLTINSCGVDDRVTSIFQDNTTEGDVLENEIIPVSQDNTTGSTVLESGTTPTSSAKDLEIPDISSFLSTPSDQFLMDFSLLIDGHCFRGLNSINPHAGGHLYLNNADNAWPKDGINIPTNYPPIYAVTDGIIDHIDTYFPVGDNYRYGVSLTVATKNGQNVNLLYSIEPFINPNDSEFYKPYILVQSGDVVTKGQIIAYFYLPPDTGSNNAHIHFHMNHGSAFLAPAIFTTQIVEIFHSKFSTRGVDGSPENRLPACMGYRLSPTENPFEPIAVDILP